MGPFLDRDGAQALPVSGDLRWHSADQVLSAREKCREWGHIGKAKSFRGEESGWKSGVRRNKGVQVEPQR